MTPEEVDEATREMTRQMNLIRVRRVPVSFEDYFAAAFVTATVKLVALFPLAWLVMLALASLHADGLPVPALGYWTVYLTLASVWLLSMLLRRVRWFGE